VLRAAGDRGESRPAEGTATVVAVGVGVAPEIEPAPVKAEGAVPALVKPAVPPVGAPASGSSGGFVAPPPLPWTASEFIEKEIVAFLGLEPFARLAPEPAEAIPTPDETVAHDDIEGVDDTEDS